RAPLLRTLLPHIFPSAPCPPRPLRHLYSFPTRRSSDLGRPFLDNDEIKALHFPVSYWNNIHPLQTHLHKQTNIHPHLQVEQSRKDRKSTRLNSSHVSISYAVFCLKKKKRAYGVGTTVGL